MTASLPDWIMLERFVFYRDIAAFPDSEAAPFRADGTSSHNGSFSIAFRVRNPPDISRLYLQWPTGPKGGSPCLLMAAHRNLLLFRLTPEPVSLSKAPFVDFRQDHFICGAQSSPSEPLLLLKIPKCHIPQLVSATNGKKVTMPRLFDLEPLSILCRGEDEFALAQLNFRRSNDNILGKLKAELCVMRSKVTSSRHNWKIEKCPIQYEAHERFDLDYWRTDRIIAFNKHLCWVNYGGGGILFCEVFQKKPPISYLRLPILKRCFLERPLAFHETNRGVSVTRGSMGCEELRFIDIVRKDGKLIGPLGSGDMEVFTITCYALRIMESGAMEWDMLFFITCYELWNVNPFLPHAPLKHPVVSMSCPNVVHFLMSEHLPQIIDKVSVVSVDMSTKRVLSINAYINGEEDLKGQDADMVRKNSTFLQTFLPSELPKFLNSNQAAPSPHPSNPNAENPSLPNCRSTAMGAGPLDWMMLEPFVFRWDDGFSFPGRRTMPFRAQGTSSHGGPFTVGIRIVAPPGISRLYLQWPGGPKEGSSCTLMAVHHNLLMFRLTSNPVKMRDESLIWRQEYFITQGGQLHQIPECTQRSVHLQSVGILPGSEQSYVIAQLCLNRSRLPAKIEAELCILRSNKWKLLPNLRIEHKAHELSDFSRWRTDRVICFQDNLCWVSYFSGGILFSDVLSKKPNISYLRLPINDQHRCTEYHRLQDMHCSLCITDSGSKLMFISVTPEDLNIVGPMPPGTDFIVTCYTLATLGTEEGRWERGFFISSNELWGSNVSLPLNALMFPFVSVTKSNELYFLLSEQGEGGIDKVSVIALDTNSSAVTSHPYIKGGTDLLGKDRDMVRKKSRHIDPFFLFQFPSSLGPTS